MQRGSDAMQHCTSASARLEADGWMTLSDACSLSRRPSEGDGCRADETDDIRRLVCYLLGPKGETVNKALHVIVWR